MYKSKIAIAILVLFFISPLVSASPDHYRKYNNHNRYSEHDKYNSHDRHGKHDRHKRHDRYHEKHHHRAMYGKVKRVKPVYRTVRIEKPRRHCRHNDHRRTGVTVVHQHSPDRIIMGGILGGIVGHELGHPANREISTLAGVVIGSALAQNTASVSYAIAEGQDRYNNECHRHMRVIEKQKLVGYKVKYKYRGRIYTTRTDYHPGKHIPVRPGPGKRNLY